MPILHNILKKAQHKSKVYTLLPLKALSKAAKVITANKEKEN